MSGLEIDQQVIAIGAPKCGKTTIAHGLCLAHLKRFPQGVALVHDVNAQFRDLCALYETVQDWRDARELARANEEPFPHGAAFTGFDQSEEIAKLAFEIGRQRNTAFEVRTPIFCAFDETAAIEDSGSTFIGRMQLRISTQRRHLGISLAYNLTRESALMSAFYETATDVFVFRQSSEESVRAIEKKIGLPKGSLMRLLTAPNYEYAHWQAGKGLI